MKSFFANMNLARWIIVLSILASVGLGAWGWTLHKERVVLEEALVASVPKKARDLQVLARRCSRLRSEFDREGLVAQTNPEEYIRSLAGNPDVALGGVDISGKTDSRMKGVADLKFTIKPQVAKTAHGRNRIANFMWMLEQKSRRVRVTCASGGVPWIVACCPMSPPDDAALRAAC